MLLTFRLLTEVEEALIIYYGSLSFITMDVIMFLTFITHGTYVFDIHYYGSLSFSGARPSEFLDFQTNLDIDVSYRNPGYINIQCSGGAHLRPTRQPHLLSGGSHPPHPPKPFKSASRLPIYRLFK